VEPRLTDFQRKYAEALSNGMTDVLSSHGHLRNLTERLKTHYEITFSKIPDLELPSAIKQTLALSFSKWMRQSELPEVGEYTFKIFPQSIVVWVSKRVAKMEKQRRKAYKHRLLFSILSVKRVMPGVSKDFILKSYEKHGKLLSTVGVTPKNILEYARLRAIEFGKQVAMFYDPTRTTLPSRSSCFEAKKSEGGQWGLLKENAKDDFSYIRSEPTVLLLSGAPGCGKSRLVNLIAGRICLNIGVPMGKSIYTRNCSVKHWDGYSGQPITVLDDWGQDVQMGEDVSQLIALVTDNQYVLPMASLHEKGTTFTSKFIIVCTNRFKLGELPLLGGALSSRELYDYRAMYRRFHFGIRILDGRSNGDIKYIKLDKVLNLCGYAKESENPHEMFADLTRKDNFRPCLVETTSRGDFVQSLADKLRTHSDGHLNSISLDLPEAFAKYKWNQTLYDFRFGIDSETGQKIYPGTRYSDRLSFDMFPDETIKSRVMTCAVNNKPLAVRMITKGSAEGRCLKPLQVAMWKALQLDPKFFCTGNPDVQKGFDLNLKRNLNDDEFYLSGDYDASTDRLHLDLSMEILEGILENINHEPTKRWARYEFGEHLIEYPPWTKIDTIEQKRGQLMGNLLSFPILCLANKIVCEIAELEDFIVNGDDLLAIANERQIENWRVTGTSCGLLPSIGKNYVSKNFGTFNSKLIVDKIVTPFVQPNLMRREGKSIASCFKEASLNGAKPVQLIRRNQNWLKKSMRSLDVPVEFGGLGKEFRTMSKSLERQARLVYLYMISRKKGSQQNGNSLLPEGFVWGRFPVIDGCENPYISEDRPRQKDDIETMLGWENESEAKEVSELIVTRKELKKFEKILMTSFNLRRFVDSGELQTYPSLSSVVKQLRPIRKSQYESAPISGLTAFIEMFRIKEGLTLEESKDEKQAVREISRTHKLELRKCKGSESPRLRKSIKSMTCDQAYELRHDVKLTLNKDGKMYGVLPIDKSSLLLNQRKNLCPKL